jgi:outer membrane protein assembly factor BamD
MRDTKGEADADYGPVRSAGETRCLGYTFAIPRPGLNSLSDVSMPSNFRTPLLALTTVALLATAGCGHNRSKELLGSADKLYEAAKKASDQGNYRDATKYYETLEARYPFSNPAKQGQLDLMYAYYRNAEPESAIDQADTFIRENPAHPRVDYAYYIKGLAQFERNPNFLERWFRADLSERPPIDARKSFQAFQTLVERYPNSEYAADARQRMIFLRNRLAAYEVYVANYYLKRGAYVGAINRCKYTIENYDGAPQMRHALEIMAESYDRLSMTELAASTRKVLQENYAQAETNEAQTKSWWKFW